MRKHEFPPADGSGRSWCLHCGALRHAQMDATCIDRADPAPDKPRARVSAMDDIDAIYDRIKELRAENDRALQGERPAELLFQDTLGD